MFIRALLLFVKYFACEVFRKNIENRKKDNEEVNYTGGIW